MTIHPFATLTADEAAALINDGDFVGFSAFTASGAAKAVPRALSARARALHAEGNPMKIRLIAGASTGDAIDEQLAQAEAISWRVPYQSSRTLRDQINNQQAQFLDIHLSHLGQMLDFGFFGEVDIAIAEAVAVTRDGRIYLSTSSGATPSILQHAKKIVVELNEHHPQRLADMHDIASLPKPPRRSPIPIINPLTKIGVPFVSVDPKKIVGVVNTNEPDGVSPFGDPGDAARGIARHVSEFLVREMSTGRIPPEFLPLQAGVGNVANAVLGAIGANPDIPPFHMYTEVLQDSQIELMKSGKLVGASTSALTISDGLMPEIADNMDFFTPRVVIRPTELSNNPGVVRRLGVITMNTALEMDIYGNANSTHVAGTKLMNGIGGSGDFTRNAYLSILMAPSLAKGGRISAVVPMCSHVDHSEHSVQILVTEQGLADLRGLGPIQRARKIIDNCAHPSYRDYLHDYLNSAPIGHIRHDLGRCFELHRNLIQHGEMLPGVATSTG